MLIGVVPSPLAAQEFDDFLSDTVNQLGTETQEIWDEFQWGSSYNASSNFATTGTIKFNTEIFEHLCRIYT